MAWETREQTLSDVQLRVEATSASGLQGTRAVPGRLRSLQQVPQVPSNGITAGADFIAHQPLAPGASSVRVTDRLGRPRMVLDREALHKARRDDMPISKLVTQFGVSNATIYRILRDPGTGT